MKRLITSIAFLLFAVTGMLATDSDGIYLCVKEPARKDMPAEAASQLATKLKQLLTIDGVADETPNGRFVITVKPVILSKDIIAGPPQMVAMNMDFTFMVGDIVENKVFETYTISAKGVGQNENKAFITALKKVNPRDPNLSTLLKNAKEKMIQYYKERCPQIIASAKQKAASRDFDAAIYDLMQIPSSCDCQQEAQQLMLNYYSARQEDKAATILTNAKAKWAANPNADGAAEVAQILKDMPAGSKSQAEADKLMKEVESKLKADEKREWDFQMQQYRDSVAQQKAENAARRQEIEACRQIGLAYASQPIYVNYESNIILW